MAKSADEGDGGRRGLLASLGPGLLWAGAAVGVSHLVQSTRAGARSGFTLVWAVVLANVFKYPFFEIGPRYAASTGESLIAGYRRLGRWALALYLVFTVATMFPVLAAITVVTAGLAGQLVPQAGLSVQLWSTALLAACAAILALGQYPLLDKLIKVVIIALTVSTLVAVAMAAGKPTPTVPGFVPPSSWDAAGFSFLIGLMGWMPAPIDIAAWHSLWTLERRKQTGHAPTLKQALFDYNVGFVGTAILALGFLSLGALVMYGSGATFPGGAVGFAGQLIQLYTQSLGAWSHALIGAAAFTTMFSTSITVLDAYPRVLAHAMALRGSATASTGAAVDSAPRAYWGALALLVAGALGVLYFGISELKRLVDFATTMSFLVAPALAWINFRVIDAPDVPAAARLPKHLRLLAWAGLVFLVGFGGVYLWKLLAP